MGQRHLTAVSWPSSKCYIAALQVQQQACDPAAVSAPALSHLSDHSFVL